MNTPADDSYDANAITRYVECAGCAKLIEIYGSYREVEDQSYKDHLCNDCEDADA